MGLFVGTSGWAYPEWKPQFYPQDLPQKRFLEHYATKLTACEINATYHRRQEESTLTKWAEAVPDGFRFAVKGHRAISPRMQDGTLLDEFTASMRTLGPHLSALFFQFPLKRDGNEESFERFLEKLGGAPPAAFDLKHPSWHTPDIENKVADAGGTLCLSDREGKAPDALPAGPIAYARLRGGTYAATERAKWKSLLDEEAARRDVYVFVKHDEGPGDEYTGVGLAQWLLH
ncbi:MAG: DUF72 domain-containing protein [Actinomycetota bacterium]|nr:DUF72 domain-containing protein [Actinomycetota bacterium]